MPDGDRNGDDMREAVVHVPDEAMAAMGLADLVSLLREAGLVAATELACHGAGGLVALSLEEPLPADRLRAADGVAWVERLAGDDPARYLLKVEADDPDIAAPSELVHDVVALEPDGASFSVVGPQEAVVRHVREIDAAGPGVTLSQFTDYAGPSEALDALTARQREVVEVAHEAGYYEVPRTASVADVAERLELDPSTVGEHLQRAQRNLVSRILAP